MNYHHNRNFDNPTSSNESSLKTNKGAIRM